MSERIIVGYKRLFEVRLLHHYWLDWGATVFDQLPEDAKERAKLPLADQTLPTRDQLLRDYDVRKLLSITPVADTEKQLKGLNCIFCSTSGGFIVGIPKDAKIPENLKLEFVIKVRNAGFYNYSSMTLRSQKIYELLFPPGDKIYRYKVNVPVFSNRNGSTKTTNGKTFLYLSCSYPTYDKNVDYEAESIVSSGDSLYEARCDSPGSLTKDWQKIGKKALLPIFVHQADKSAILLPGEMQGLNRGIELKKGISDYIFALICIEKLNGTHTHRLTDGVTIRSPVFEIRFKNRSTLWKYIKKTTGAIDSIGNDPFPLTCFGNAGRKQKPSEGFVKLEFKDNDPLKIKNLYSEVFI